MILQELGCHNMESLETRLSSHLVDGVLALDAGSLSRSLSFKKQSKLKDRTSNQLINTPPGRHGKSSMMKLPPLTPSSSADDGGTSSGGAVPTEPMFSPHDKSNHYTLLNASMCNILGSK